MTSSNLPEVLRMARPRKTIRAYIDIRGELAIVRLEDGAVAVIPLQEACKLAERFNIEYENYLCQPKSS